jgi:hypothetical protein
MTLREHMRELHPHAPNRRSNDDLANYHGQLHHQFSGAQDHYHTGPNRGPDERPPGWRTGDDVVKKG